jgi:hypothetical protein
MQHGHVLVSMVPWKLPVGGIRLYSRAVGMLSLFCYGVERIARGKRKSHVYLNCNSI